MSMQTYDAEAEKAVIGACIRDNDLIDDAILLVRPDDFYVYAHQLAWAAVVSLWTEYRLPVDLITLAEHLRARNIHGPGGKTTQTQLDEVGGGAYLLTLFDGAPVVANIHAYCGIVATKAKYRVAARLGQQLAEEATRQASSAEVVISKAQDGLFELQSRTHGDGPVTMASVMKEAIDTIDKRRGRADGEIEEAVPTGWADLDRLLVGFHKSELCVLAARPSVGKTLLAGNIVASAAARGLRVFFASLEQPYRELGIRWLCSEASVDSWKCRSGKIDQDDVERIMVATERMREWRVHVDDQNSQTMGRIAAHSRKLKFRSGLDLVVIDYLQIVRPEFSAPRHEQVAEISRKMKQLARDLDLPVVALAQVNRESEKSGEGKPKLSHLRESGNIEQDADTVLMLHKPAPCETSETDLITVEVAKQRNGPKGEVQLVHHKRTFRVTCLEKTHEVF